MKCATKTSDFDFTLPPEQIATHPVSPRDTARLLHVGATVGDLEVGDLPGLLRAGDVLVVNNTKVIPARLTGRRGTAKVEVTLHKQDAPGLWRAFARPAKKLSPGDRIDFAADFHADVVAKGEAGEVTLQFDRGGDALQAALAIHGVMPLPPYIKRKTADENDRTDYQTIFATHAGAVAAPTASLHFSPNLVAALKAAGVSIAEVTLHVGAGTFLPVKTETVEDHKMHAEWGRITPAVAAQLNAARAAGGRIVAAGTTALRLLESAAMPDGEILAFEGETDIFILPGYRFKGTDLLLTNFHLPRSTLLMLVAAFSGRARILAAYDHAIAAGYRFYSYGDCCLLEPEIIDGAS